MSHSSVHIQPNNAHSSIQIIEENDENNESESDEDNDEEDDEEDTFPADEDSDGEYGDETVNGNSSGDDFGHVPIGKEDTKIRDVN